MKKLTIILLLTVLMTMGALAQGYERFNIIGDYPTSPLMPPMFIWIFDVTDNTTDNPLENLIVEIYNEHNSRQGTINTSEYGICCIIMYQDYVNKDWYVKIRDRNNEYKSIKEYFYNSGHVNNTFIRPFLTLKQYGNETKLDWEKNVPSPRDLGAHISYGYYEVIADNIKRANGIKKFTNFHQVLIGLERAPRVSHHGGTKSNNYPKDDIYIHDSRKDNYSNNSQNEKTLKEKPIKKESINSNGAKISDRYCGWRVNGSHSWSKEIGGRLYRIKMVYKKRPKIQSYPKEGYLIELWDVRYRGNDCTYLGGARLYDYNRAIQVIKEYMLKN